MQGIASTSLCEDGKLNCVAGSSQHLLKLQCDGYDTGNEGAETMIVRGVVIRAVP